jgi:hypothetical protein
MSAEAQAKGSAVGNPGFRAGVLWSADDGLSGDGAEPPVRVRRVGAVRHGDLTGRVFGRLRVLRVVEVRLLSNGRNRVMWLCECSCGAVRAVATDGLVRDRGTRSCGCLNKEVVGANSYRHGGNGAPEYRAWVDMRSRCANDKNPRWKDWGGRGITVCERWLRSFEAFFSDVGPRPSPKHSLDRYPDNDGNYEPGNVRWATKQEQSRNRRDNRLLTFQGRTQTLAAWAVERGFNPATLGGRLERGWDLAQALTEAPAMVGRRASR